MAVRVGCWKLDGRMVALQLMIQLFATSDALMASTFIFARNLKYGSPTSAGLALAAVRLHLISLPCRRVKLTRANTTTATSRISTLSTAIGSVRHEGPQPGGLAASRWTEARVSDVTKMAHAKKRGVGQMSDLGYGKNLAGLARRHGPKRSQHARSRCKARGSEPASATVILPCWR